MVYGLCAQTHLHTQVHALTLQEHNFSEIPVRPSLLEPSTSAFALKPKTKNA